jgi:hypothetical protein
METDPPLSEKWAGVTEGLPVFTARRRGQWKELATYATLVDSRTARCLICNESKKLDKDWAPKNICTHLVKMHPSTAYPTWVQEQGKDAEAAPSSPPSSSSSSSSSSETVLVPIKDTSVVLAEAALMGDWPVDLSHRYDVQHIMENFYPGLAVPGRSAQRTAMDKVIAETLEELAASLKESFFADGKWTKLHADSDKWTNPWHKHFLSLSVTGVDKNWVLRTHHLALDVIAATAKASDIAGLWREALKRHDLPPQAIAVMNTDGEYVMPKAVREEIKEWVYNHCFNHFLNLVDQDVCYQTEKKTKKLNTDTFYGLAVHHVTTFLAPFVLSHKRRAILAEVCIKAGIKPLAPVFDMPTRWWIKVRMLERMVHFHPALAKMTGKDASALFDIKTSNAAAEQAWIDSFTWFQQKMQGTLQHAPLTDLIESILRPADIASALLETRHFVNASLVLPILGYLESKWTAVSKNDLLCKEVRDTASAFLTSLAKRKQAIGRPAMQMFEAATIFDPLTFGWASTEMCNRVKVFMNTEAAKFLPKDSLRVSVATSAKARVFGGSQYTVTVHTNGDMPLKAVEDEGLAFVNEMESRKGPAPYALDYWKANAKRYPVLAVLARDCLGVRTGSSTSEAAFSIAKLGMPRHRSRTSPQFAGERFIARMELVRRRTEKETASGTRDAARVAKFMDTVRSVLGDTFPEHFGSPGSAPLIDECGDVGEEQGILLAEGQITPDGSGYYVEYVYTGLTTDAPGALAGSKRDREGEDVEGAGAGAAASQQTGK